MTRTNPSLSETVLALRREFDLSFAQATDVGVKRSENLLAVRVGGDAYAFRVNEIAGLYADRSIMPFPSPLPELLGVAGFRGQVAPVYDLAALLGYAHQITPRWMILVRFATPVAFAFDAFDAHLAVTPDQIVAAAGTASRDQTTRPHLLDAVRTDKAVRAIIQLQSVLAAIQQRVDATRPMKER